MTGGAMRALRLGAPLNWYRRWTRWMSAAPRGFRWAVRGVWIAVALGWAALYLSATYADWLHRMIGWDFAFYVAGAREWMETGTPYTPESLAGPMVADVYSMPFLHPPIALPLFAAFTLLPGVFWWAIPLLVLGVSIWRWNPTGIAFYGVLVCAVYPRTMEVIGVGGSDMWISAIIAAGLALGWPLALVAIKPTAILFVLPGIRRRSFWAGALLVGVAAIPFGTLWFDWMTVVRNVAGSVGYLLHSLPFLALPLLAWAGRTSRSGT